MHFMYIGKHASGLELLTLIAGTAITPCILKINSGGIFAPRVNNTAKIAVNRLWQCRSKLSKDETNCSITQFQGANLLARLNFDD
jgi:hypothetical protein